MLEHVVMQGADSALHLLFLASGQDYNSEALTMPHDTKSANQCKLASGESKILL